MCHVCVCMHMCECEIRHHKCCLVMFLIVLTQALKISLHAEAPWFSRLQNACNTEELTNTCILMYYLLHPCVLMYLSERVGHCTEMWPSYTSVYTSIFLFPCVLSFFFKFLCKRSFFLPVTNLLINCEDVSCLLTCAQITSWFFCFLFCVQFCLTLITNHKSFKVGR